MERVTELATNNYIVVMTPQRFFGKIMPLFKQGRRYSERKARGVTHDDLLGFQHFRLLIIDECHLVANVHKVQGKCLLAAVHRMKAKLLLLTGTPLQNELKELGYLLMLLDRERWVDVPSVLNEALDHKTGRIEEEFMKELHDKYMQRSTRADLVKKKHVNALPACMSLILWIKPEEVHRDAYELFRNGGLDVWNRWDAEEKALKKHKAEIVPDNVYIDEEDVVEDCGKENRKGKTAERLALVFCMITAL